jgi:dienelactone hydrolase
VCQHQPMRRLLTLIATLALLVAACSDDGDTSSSDTTRPGVPTDESTTTTVDPTAAARAFADPGPFPVGVTTLELAKGPSVEVWYPAVEGTTGTVSYDVRDFTPPAIRDILTGDAAATFEHDGQRDADVADGSFPVVLFSHGFTGIRLQSSVLTSHLASHGMVVVAPDHPSRDLTNVLGGTASGDRDDAVDDLLLSLDLIVEQGEAPGPFEGRIDADRVAALGHSAGGGTILGAALDERVDGYVSMASGGPEDPADFPSVPSFFLAGATDGVVSPAERTRPAYDAAPSPSWYWEIEAVGHNGFDDFCTFGNGTGIIGIAEASGLGGLLDAQPQLRTLGEDGCVAPAAPIDQAFPIVRHGVTSWLTWLFDGSDEPVGLEEVPGVYDLGITAESK